MRNKLINKILLFIFLAGTIVLCSAVTPVLAERNISGELSGTKTVDEEVLTASPLEGYTAIHNRDELANINRLYGHKFYLANDIDLAGEDWIPITYFDGIFDGQGHTIKNMTVNPETYIADTDAGFMMGGLFGEICCDSEYETKVCNLNLENVSITSGVNDTGYAGGCGWKCKDRRCRNCLR